MSYILDALKRAKAERDRGAAPSIHMAPPPQLADEDEDDEAPRGASAAAAQGQPMRWVVIGLSAALLLSLGWQFLGGSASSSSEVDASRDARPGRPGPGDRPPQGLPGEGHAGMRPPMTGQGDGGMPPPVQQGMPQPARPALAPAPVPAPAPAPLAAAPLPSAAPRPAPAPAVAAPPSAPTAPAPAPTASAAATQELPDDLRRSLAVSGSRYSDNPASRIVFINGQVFREGDQPAAGVTIERIGLKSVILAGRGQRYELKY
jgi:general secretion pathway protein B